MLAAVTAALEIRARLGIEGVAAEEQIDRAIADAGLVLWADAPLEGAVYGLFVGGVVAIKPGLWPGTRLVVKAHEAGHGVLGHEAARYEERAVGEPTAKEILAQLFAFALLVGRPASTHDGLTAQMHAAHDAGVPLGFLCTAVSILTQPHPDARGLLALC